MTQKPCLFCDIANPDRHVTVAKNELIYAGQDKNPVTKGHTHLSPIRHVESVFDLTDEEWSALHRLSKQVRDILHEKYGVHDFTIGFNEGRLAGRTIDHVHMHIIPRYQGDVEEPRGGIRHIIPEKGDYLA